MFLNGLKMFLKRYQNTKADETGCIEFEENEYESYLEFLRRGL